jgi:transcriptional regulator with XRE-family HTH domain
MSRELAALKKKIGSKIRGRRNSLRMSQEELAFQAELTPTYVSQIETGQRNPSLEALFRLCAALKTELSDLFRA